MEAQRTSIERIDVELRRMWTNAGPDRKGVTRVQTTNIIALCETAAHARIAEPALARAAAVHAARTILVTWKDATKPSLDARVSLHDSRRPGIPGGEAIVLEALGRAREWVPDTIGRLLTADLPVYVWWVGDLPDNDEVYEIFHRVASVANLAIFNSNDMDLRDLPRLDAVAATPVGRSAVADFCWQRLRSWQELTARFFDEPRCVVDLASIDTVEIAFHPRARDAEPVSNQAALFAGWLMTALGWKLRGWSSRDPQTPVATLVNTKGAPIALRFATRERRGAPDGSLVEVSLARSAGGANEARFHLARDSADPLVICWSGTHPTVTLPQQCVRIGLPDDAKMLARVIEQPVRDPLYEASLHSAALLVADIAPGAPDARR